MFGRIVSSTRREKRLGIEDYKKLMVFEVDPKKLAEYQSKIDELFGEASFKIEFPELFI